MITVSAAGAGKSVIWYDDLPVVGDRKLMLFGCSVVLWSSRIFALCRNLGSQQSHASDSELADCLKDMLKLPGQATVYMVIDALDECPKATSSQFPREKVLEIVEDLVKS